MYIKRVCKAYLWLREAANSGWQIYLFVYDVVPTTTTVVPRGASSLHRCRGWNILVFGTIGGRWRRRRYRYIIIIAVARTAESSAAATASAASAAAASSTTTTSHRVHRLIVVQSYCRRRFSWFWDFGRRR